MNTETATTSAPIKRLKQITSYAGHSRFLAECEPDEKDGCAKFFGHIERTEIPSPYASGPTHCVYRWRNQNIIIVETSHKVYGVFAVPDGMPIFATEADFFAASAYDAGSNRWKVREA